MEPVRQRGVVERLAERIAASADLEAGLLLGSLARGDADDLSDVDAFVIVRKSRFDAAWSKRHALRGDEALASWDDVDPERHEIAAPKRPPIERAELRAFADMRVATGRAHEIEGAYEWLVNAVRQAGAG